MASHVLIAQVTDTHVVGAGNEDELHVDNNGRLAAAVEVINGEDPPVDVVLATGDLVNDGRAAEYESLAELVEPLRPPLLPLPGNHDDRDLLRATFPDVPWVDAEHASWATTIGDDPTVRIVGLDTTIAGVHPAELDADRDAWLRAALTEPHGGPTILAMHHPPFASGIAFMDRSGFVRGLDRLVAILGDHPVDRIVSGHLHRPVQSSVAGVPATVAPSTVQHVALDLAPDAGVAFALDPVGYQLHLVTAAGIVSHTRHFAPVNEPFVPGWARAADDAF